MLCRVVFSFGSPSFCFSASTESTPTPWPPPPTTRRLRCSLVLLVSVGASLTTTGPQGLPLPRRRAPEAAALVLQPLPRHLRSPAADLHCPEHHLGQQPRRRSVCLPACLHGHSSIVHSFTEVRVPAGRPQPASQPTSFLVGGIVTPPFANSHQHTHHSLSLVPLLLPTSAQRLSSAAHQRRLRKRTRRGSICAPCVRHSFLFLSFRLVLVSRLLSPAAARSAARAPSPAVVRLRNPAVRTYLVLGC